MFRQARWREPTVFELGEIGDGVLDGDEYRRALKYLPEKLVRRSGLRIPDLPEFQVVRHFTRLSQENYGVDLGIYPLGSCTMKYNPRISEEVAALEGLRDISPHQDEEEIQGVLEVMYRLSRILSLLTGMDEFSLQPAAGAQGEFVGVLIMKKYFEVRGEERDEIIVPDTAHGTNPASAKMGGFKVVEIPSDERGMVNPRLLREVVNERTAGLMLTNPNTLGLFEENILEIADILHENGSLLYYDGANLNAIVGWARPGDMGFDIVHTNLHKTFSTPHGGGGPGSGPVGVKSFLRDFLPVPIVVYRDGMYRWEWGLKHSIGKVHMFYGNFLVALRAYTYILSMGLEGLRRASSIAVMNSNYLFRKVSRLRGVEPYPRDSRMRMHEFVVSLESLRRETGVSARDVAKRILDYGVYAPTTYFPIIVPEALMVEPTETVGKRDLDHYASVVERVVEEAYNEPDKIINSPVNTTVGRLDEAYGSRPRTMKPSERWGRRDG